MARAGDEELRNSTRVRQEADRNRTATDASFQEVNSPESVSLYMSLFPGERVVSDAGSSRAALSDV